MALFYVRNTYIQSHKFSPNICDALGTKVVSVLSKCNTAADGLQMNLLEVNIQDIRPAASKRAVVLHIV